LSFSRMFCPGGVMAAALASTSVPSGMSFSVRPGAPIIHMHR
jgi:hypothetical protein